MPAAASERVVGRDRHVDGYTDLDERAPIVSGTGGRPAEERRADPHVVLAGDAVQRRRRGAVGPDGVERRPGSAREGRCGRDGPQTFGALGPDVEPHAIGAGAPPGHRAPVEPAARRSSVGALPVAGCLREAAPGRNARRVEVGRVCGQVRGDRQTALERQGVTLRQSPGRPRRRTGRRSDVVQHEVPRHVTLVGAAARRVVVAQPDARSSGAALRASIQRPSASRSASARSIRRRTGATEAGSTTRRGAPPSSMTVVRRTSLGLDDQSVQRVGEPRLDVEADPRTGTPAPCSAAAISGSISVDEPTGAPPD